MFPTFKNRGFTLSELIIALVLVFIMVGVVGFVYRAGFQSFYFQQARSTEKGEAGPAFINLARELRASDAVTNATATGVTFTVDTDGDGLDETIQYTWSGTAGQPLQRISGSTSAVVNTVESLVFSYYNSANQLLTFPVTASVVRTVVLDLTAKNQNESFHMRSQIRLRELD